MKNDLAFPVNTSEFHQPVNNLGLTKREWFAGMALQGLLANPAMVKGFSPQHLRRQAWKEADAMLREGEGE